MHGFTWDILTVESFPNKSPRSFPISQAPIVIQDRKSSAHCKMLSIMLPTAFVSSDRKHLQ